MRDLGRATARAATPRDRGTRRAPATDLQEALTRPYRDSGRREATRRLSSVAEAVKGRLRVLAGAAAAKGLHRVLAEAGSGPQPDLAAAANDQGSPVSCRPGSSRERLGECRPVSLELAMRQVLRCCCG